MGCSVVIHEGMYIDAMEYLGHTLRGFSLELVGVNEVRLVNIQKCLQVAEIRLTIRNVFIYDRRVYPFRPTMYITHQSDVTLVDVRINGPKVTALETDHKGTRLSLHSCTLIACREAFITQDGSEIHFHGCTLNNMFYGSKSIRNSVFNATDTSFNRAKSIYISGGISALHRCSFSGEWVLTGDEARIEPEPNGVFISDGCQAVVSKCQFKGFSAAVAITGSKTKATIQRCGFFACYSAVNPMMNSSAFVTHCILECLVSVEINHNVSGVIEFRRNRTPHHHGRTLPPVILKDRVSQLPKSDFKNPLTIYDDGVSSLPSSSKQSKFTKKATGQMLELAHDLKCSSPTAESVRDRDLTRNPDFCRLFKRCGLCNEIEDQQSLFKAGKEGIKFKFCSKCQKICYCSKECQEAHWNDHKLLCRQLKK